MPMWSPGSTPSDARSVRHLVGPSVELAVGHVLVTHDQSQPVRHPVGDVLEEIGDVVGHEQLED